MNTSAITLRLAQLRDAPILAAMSRDLIEAGLGWNYQPARIRRLIADPDTVALVACHRGVTVGFAVMAFGDEHGHLILLAVRPANQRHGVGRRLIEWLLESAVTAGIAHVRLELRASNQSARAFYRRLGFAETTEIPSYYGGRESALRMMRSLRVAASSTFQWRPPGPQKP